jgi:hypothetical protein
MAAMRNDPDQVEAALGELQRILREESKSVSPADVELNTAVPEDLAKPGAESLAAGCARGLIETDLGTWVKFFASGKRRRQWWRFWQWRKEG